MSDDQVTTGLGTSSRRALLTGAGAVGAAVVLAACGDDSGDEATAEGGGQPLAKTTDIPVGGGKIFADQKVVVTQPNPGQFKAFSAICTHQDCTVSRIEGGVIVCLCHDSRFSIADGSVKKPPAKRPLPAKEIKVTGDQISLA
ncbi:Rieske (2Fe-2S) protein [Micromonospora sp. DT47]|uniref:Rieske (2Fe-2S) protein n=1 Tax=Micromonospora sp. DT47 TaxID=3393431 RepID=UPI003CE6C3B8